MRETIPLKVQEYIAESGNWVVREWTNQLKDIKARSIIKRRIYHLQFGNLGDYKYVDGGIYEMRIHYGPGYRIYFGRIEDVIIVLLCGGDKSTQKHDIIKAQRYWQIFKEKNV